MSKNKKKDKAKKKSKQAEAAPPQQLEDEVRRLREENDLLRQRLEKIAGLAHVAPQQQAVHDRDDEDEEYEELMHDVDEDDEQAKEGVHPL